MGQKSSAKKKRPKKQVTSLSETSTQTVTSTSPSLVASSSTFQPKRRGPVMEELLQVRRSDMLKIAFLIGVMLIFLIVIAIINAQTPFLAEMGQRLSHAMRIQ